MALNNPQTIDWARRSLWGAIILAACALIGCSPREQIFGASYDICVLKNATKAGDEASRGIADEICARHFLRAPSTLEAEYAEGKATITFEDAAEPQSGANALDHAFQAIDHPGDTIHAVVTNGDDDVVIKQVQIEATFYDGPPNKNGGYIGRKSRGTLTWLLDADIEPGQSNELEGTFDGGKAPSRFYFAHFVATKVLPHAGATQKSHLKELP